MFRAPGSSSPFSSPEAQRNKQTSFFPASKSDTPARPPPQSSFIAASTTPAGPPPSSLFAKSNFNSAIPFPAGRNAQTSRIQDSQNVIITRQNEDRFDDAMDEDVMDLNYQGDDAQDDRVEPTSRGIRAMGRAVAQPTAELFESDQLILATEDVMESVYHFLGTDQATQIASILPSVCEDLLSLWSNAAGDMPPHATIGPSKAASPIAKALFPISLLLPLHHQPQRTKQQGAYRSSRSPEPVKSIPEILLEWLRTHHDPNVDEKADVLGFQPDPCAHDRFWDVILNSVLRGDLVDAIRLLADANLEHAATAEEDGVGEGGYSGKQLGNVQRVINRAVQVLEACPAVHRGDWNTLGPDWIIFRKKVTQALADLEVFAEGSSTDRGPDPAPSLQAENFGVSRFAQSTASIRALSRRAESRVPWTIYQNLISLYSQLLGMKAEIIASSMDWLESVVGMVVWWDGDEDDGGSANLAASRMSSSQRFRHSRTVGEADMGLYQQRFTSSLRYLADANEEDSSMHIDPTRPVEVALACVFAGELAPLFEILAGWSTVIDASVLQIARLGSWLPESGGFNRNTFSELDDSDLMVLSYATPQTNDDIVKHDPVLIAYADSLAARETLSTEDGKASTDGWMLALQVLGRLDDPNDGRRRTEGLIGSLPLTTSQRVERILAICDNLDLNDQSKATCERYADGILESSHNFGDALYYYALGHRVEKLRDVSDLLVTISVVQSRAFPPLSSLDDALRAMIERPKQTIDLLDQLDRQAAELLSLYLSGYGSLRKFYDLRDEAIHTPTTETARLSSHMRKEAAATALVTAITSAADSIHGGLYDEGVDSVIQVDVLLILLGEVLPLLNQPRRILKPAQIFAILRAVEDISSVSESIFSTCEQCLDATMSDARGKPSQSLKSTLRKSTNALTDASRSHLLESTVQSSGAGGDALRRTGQKKGQDVERAWDWRKGLSSTTSGHDVLKIVRVALAREIAAAWTADPA